jgi:hypothetical protein
MSSSLQWQYETHVRLYANLRLQRQPTPAPRLQVKPYELRSAPHLQVTFDVEDGQTLHSHRLDNRLQQANPDPAVSGWM